MKTKDIIKVIAVALLFFLLGAGVQAMFTFSSELFQFHRYSVAGWVFQIAFWILCLLAGVLAGLSED